MTKRVAVAGSLAIAIWLLNPTTAQAHGIGGRLDLPVPLSYFVVAAAIVLVVSFLALALLWPSPRFDDRRPMRRLGALPKWSARFLAALGVIALLLVAGQVVPALLGLDRDRSRPTIAPVLVWVVMWLIVPFLSAFVGNWYRCINPWRTIGRAHGDEQTSLLERTIGVWPAAFGLVSLGWFELISPWSSNPLALGWAAIGYSVYLLVVMSLLGRETGLYVADLFTVYNRVISAISPLGRDRDGDVVWRGWLRALPRLPEWPGLTFFMLAAIGTVTYDGSSGTGWFRNFTGSLSQGRLGQTILLVACIAVVSLAYWAACWSAARLAPGSAPADVARRFAHTLVPIALAYAVAHYFTLIVFEGQQIISAISDPFGLGWDVFGTADRTVDFFFTATRPVWYVQLAVIIVGHVMAVVLAHERALVDFGRDAVRSQYAMLLLMVALTSLGLAILAG